MFFLREIEGEDAYQAAVRVWRLPENREDREFSFTVGCHVAEDMLVDGWDGNIINTIWDIIVMARENREIVRNMTSFIQN